MTLDPDLLSLVRSKAREIQARCEKAAKRFTQVFWPPDKYGIGRPPEQSWLSHVEPLTKADTEFLEHARDDIPWLLKQLDEIATLACHAQAERTTKLIDEERRRWYAVFPEVDLKGLAPEVAASHIRAALIRAQAERDAQIVDELMPSFGVTVSTEDGSNRRVIITIERARAVDALRAAVDPAKETPTPDAYFQMGQIAKTQADEIAEWKQRAETAERECVALLERLTVALSAPSDASEQIDLLRRDE